MKANISITVNRKRYQVEVEPLTTLLEMLRNQLSLTGTKEGCGEGDCGTCTVIVDGKAVNACLLLAMEARDKEVLTIEGLAEDGSLHPLQKAFIEKGAVQCGFCIPGMIMSAKAFLDTHPSPSDEEIKLAIAGNLCRCTGYVKIIEAIRSVA